MAFKEVFYHASTDPTDKFYDYVYLARDPYAALPYLGGHPGYLHRVEVQSSHLRLATEDEVPTGSYDYVFEALKDSAVLEQLEDVGYDGVEFEDLGPDNMYQHKTVLLFAGSTARVVSVAEIPRMHRYDYDDLDEEKLIWKKPHEIN